MKDLSKARDEIDNIDTQIIKLFEQRMDIVKDIANYKIENNLPVLDSSRENMMLEKNLKKITNEEYKKYYFSVLKGFLEASKEMQKEIIAHKK